jgi:hypothetical protein
MKGAQRGHAASQRALGILLSTAEQPETRVEALGWLLAAQENGASNLQSHLAKAHAEAQSAQDDPIVRSTLRNYGRAAIARDWLPSYTDPNYDPCRASVWETDPDEPKGDTGDPWQSAAIVLIERNRAGKLVDFHSVFRLPNGTDNVMEEIYLEGISKRERTHPVPPNECRGVDTLIVRSARKSNKSEILEAAAKLADRGTPEGHYVLGLALLLSNQPGGFDLVKIAAQGGHADAQYYVSKHLRNRVLARKWLELAADGGVAAAQIDLANELLATDDRASHLPRVERLVASASSSLDDYVLTRVAAIRAAAPDTELRNAQAASEAARHVNTQKWPLPIRYEAIALSFAASGDFTRAARSQKTAIARSESMGHDTSRMEARLRSFEAKQMWFGYLAAEYR